MRDKKFRGSIMISTITFDFGGVLYFYDENNFLKAISNGASVNKRLLNSGFANSNLARAHFKGEMGVEELASQIRKIFGSKITGEDLTEAYLSSVKPNEEIFNLVRKLEKKYRIQLFSDTPRVLYEKVIKSMPIYELFSEVTLSFEIGYLKDSPHGYKDVIAKSGHKPEQIVFIDDRDKYAKKAKELGIKGIHYRETGQLKKDLSELGVEI